MKPIYLIRTFFPTGYVLFLEFLTVGKWKFLLAGGFNPFEKY